LLAGCIQATARPNYTQGPQGAGLTCTTDPSISEELLREGQRLGVQVIAGPPELLGKDATYRAEHGRLGTIRLKQRPMSAEVRCKLISHEFIHVLQHLHGDLKGVLPLGWGPSRDQEAEAYAHQNQAGHVLHLLRATPHAGRQPGAMHPIRTLSGIPY
jgi:hypothetical protein